MKMRAELIQQIMANYKFLGGDLESCGVYSCSNLPYRGGYVNHPCTKWGRKSLDNIRYLYKILICLEQEYQFRYGPKESHSGETIKKIADWFTNTGFFAQNLPSIGFTEPELCMPDEYKCNDPVQSYRTYYLKDKVYMNNGKRMDDWGKRGKPEWWRS